MKSFAFATDKKLGYWLSTDSKHLLEVSSNCPESPNGVHVVRTVNDEKFPLAAVMANTEEKGVVAVADEYFSDAKLPFTFLAETLHKAHCRLTRPYSPVQAAMYFRYDTMYKLDGLSDLYVLWDVSGSFAYFAEGKPKDLSSGKRHRNATGGRVLVYDFRNLVNLAMFCDTQMPCGMYQLDEPKESKATSWQDAQAYAEWVATAREVTQHHLSDAYLYEQWILYWQGVRDGRLGDVSTWLIDKYGN